MSWGPQRIPDIGRSMKSRIIVGTKLSCNVTTPLFILTKPATHPSLCRWHTYNYTLYIHTQPSSVSHVSCCFETKIHGRSKHQCRRNCLNGQKWHLPIDKYKAKASISMSEKQMKWAKFTLWENQLSKKPPNSQRNVHNWTMQLCSWYQKHLSDK